MIEDTSKVEKPRKESRDPCTSLPDKNAIKSAEYDQGNTVTEEVSIEATYLRAM